MMAGNQQAMLYANTAYKAQLRLRYANRTLADVERFLDHYDGLNGTQTSFQFTSEWNKQVWGGWDAQNGDAAFIATESQWRYQAAPRLTQVKRGIGTIEVNLVQVPGSKAVLENPAGTRAITPTSTRAITPLQPRNDTIDLGPDCTPVPDPDPNPNPNPGPPGPAPPPEVCGGGGGGGLNQPPGAAPINPGTPISPPPPAGGGGGGGVPDPDGGDNSGGGPGGGGGGNSPGGPGLPEIPTYAASCGWTTTRVRMLDGADAYWDWNDRYNGTGTTSFNFVKNNPNKWLIGEFPDWTDRIIDGVQYFWPRFKYSYQILIPYGLSDCQAPFNPSNEAQGIWQTVTPCLLQEQSDNGRGGRDNPESEFFTGPVEHTPIPPRYQRRQSMYLWPVLYVQDEPPWLAPPTRIGVSDSYPIAQSFVTSQRGDDGYAFMPGFRYQVWIPNQIKGSPLSVDANGDFIWNDDGQWVDAGTGWNGGSFGGRSNECEEPPENSASFVLPPKELFAVENKLYSFSTPDYSFPAHTPSRRVMKYGDWNTKRFGGGNTGQSLALPLPSKAMKRDVLLDLVYANTTDSVARTFLNHYLSCAGEWADFALPAEKLKTGPMAGWADTDSERFLSKGRWAYAGAPQITSVHPGTSTVTLQLISLETEDYMAPPNISEPRKPLPACGSTGTQSSRSAESRSGGENPCNPDGGNINPPPAPPAPPNYIPPIQTPDQTPPLPTPKPGPVPTCGICEILVNGECIPDPACEFADKDEDEIWWRGAFASKRRTESVPYFRCVTVDQGPGRDAGCEQDGVSEPSRSLWETQTVFGKSNGPPWNFEKISNWNGVPAVIQKPGGCFSDGIFDNYNTTDIWQDNLWSPDSNPDGYKSAVWKLKTNSGQTIGRRNGISIESFVSNDNTYAPGGCIDTEQQLDYGNPEFELIALQAGSPNFTEIFYEWSTEEFDFDGPSPQQLDNSTRDRSSRRSISTDAPRFPTP